MKIYFAGAILGGRENLPVYRHIVGFLKDRGHDVLTEHVARQRVLEEESLLTPQQVYERDMEWLRDSVATIAEVSTPSLGVGYEIATTLHLKKPVLCLYQSDRTISKMVTGNQSIRTLTYADRQELENHLVNFLDAIRP
jgi:2'-deoxynucleoside 5'-phosphate N-hydrolase